MKLPRKAGTARVERSRQTAILFLLGSSTFAIDAESVDEIRNLEGLVEYKHHGHDRFRKVKYTLERQHRTYFVIDAGAQFRMPPSKPTRLLLMRRMAAGVLVDEIDQMQEIGRIHQLPLAFTGEERDWYRGLAVVKGRVVPVVRPECFLSKAEASILSASVADRLSMLAVASL
jgi:chemotaxis signal transduction protein